jgi:hypothetical protein
MRHQRGYRQRATGDSQTKMMHQRGDRQRGYRLRSEKIRNRKIGNEQYEVVYNR